TLIIGSSQTRMVNGRMVTPRGYNLLPSPPKRGEGVGGEGRQLAMTTSPNDTGSAILRESFATIERELGPHTFPPWVYAVVRRMIHASADFDFARTLRHSHDFETAMQTAFREQAPFVTDTEMVRIGIRTALADTECLTLACHLNDE